MLTKNATLVYRDCFEMQNQDIRITQENACYIIFSNEKFFRSYTTNIMNDFLDDRKTYMVFNFGSYDTKDLYLVAKYEPMKCVSSMVPSISMIKSTAIKEPWVNEKRSVNVPHERLRPLMQALVDSLPEKSESGLYTIRAKDPVYFKAQCDDDRSGFGKIWINGNLHEEKNYGDCSMVFSLVAVYIQ